MNITIIMEELSEAVKDVKFKEEQVLKGMKDTQTGIIVVTEENQEEMSKYFRLRKGSSGYPEFVMGSEDMGTVDDASYGEEYYDEKNKDMLRPGIGIMIQKTKYGEWDMYPNPSPYANENASKVYHNIDDLNSKRNEQSQIESRKDEFRFPGRMGQIVEQNMQMAYKGGYGSDSYVPTKMIKVEDVISQVMLLPHTSKIKFITEMREQMATMDGFLVLEDDGTNRLSHVVNAERDGKPIGYDISPHENKKWLRTLQSNTAKELMAGYEKRRNAITMEEDKHREIQ